jgi:predicted nucleotidyltransferase
MIFQLDYAIQKRLLISPEQLSAFCQDWKINELALFGSILRSDFRDDSDIELVSLFIRAR